jgi:hypothetical protein
VSEHISSQRAHVSPEHSKGLRSSSPGTPIAIYRPPFAIEMSKDKTSRSWVLKKLVQPLVNAYPSICNWNASHNWKCQILHTNHIPHVIKWCGLYSKQLHLYKTDTVLATKVLPSKNSRRVKTQYIYVCVCVCVCVCVLVPKKIYKIKLLNHLQSND